MVFSAPKTTQLPVSGTGGGGNGGGDATIPMGGAAQPGVGGLTLEDLEGPLRATGLWRAEEVQDAEKKTVDFRRIDDVETDIAEDLTNRSTALVEVADEDAWRSKLMFVHKFKKTPKHLTWKELGQEITCTDCIIDPDPHRPEEVFTIKFFFVDRSKGTRDLIWEARNDINESQGFTDLAAAIGSCLGRADVFRTIRFDDALGTIREMTIKKRAKFTSDITLSFRPPVNYNVYDRKQDTDEWEKAMDEQEMSSWGFHPGLMEPEHVAEASKDPPGTYTLAMSAHGFSFVFLRAIERLLDRPMEDFYRASQLAKSVRRTGNEHMGLSHAMRGWMGMDERVFPHYTTIEAIQDHWVGNDVPFNIIMIVNKLREMTYLKRRNPEFHSWLTCRKRDTAIAFRNSSVKLLGAGASTLFVPKGHHSSINRLLPKSQQRRLHSSISVNALLGMPDETRKLGAFKTLTGESHQGKISASNNDNSGGVVEKKKKSSTTTTTATASSSPPAE